MTNAAITTLLNQTDSNIAADIVPDGLKQARAKVDRTSSPMGVPPKTLLARIRQQEEDTGVKIPVDVQRPEKPRTKAFGVKLDQIEKLASVDAVVIPCANGLGLFENGLFDLNRELEIIGLGVPVAETLADDPPKAAE